MLVAHKACLFNWIYMAEHLAASTWQQQVLTRATWVIKRVKLPELQQPIPNFQAGN
jgi:hypothetical protein